MKKKIVYCILIFSLILNQLNITVKAYEISVIHNEKTDSKDKKVNIELSSPSAVLIEGSTGTVIYEKDKDKQLKPASITKIMTLLLIFEALENEKITLKDEVSVSEHAASMGGSQVFLEPYETQTVDTMIKCISIASANDACVAMAEYIAGSEEEFVSKMNERAKELGMKNTHFVNCCGLDVDNHYSSAYDVALMSRELIMKHPEISGYSTTWMDSFTHVTKKGESEFGLSNTNKLVKTYDGITGLKTGSTALAKYCLSATAKRKDMNMIAVVMAAPDFKVRFAEAAKLLDYGFANCSLYNDSNKDFVIEPQKISKGVKEYIDLEPKGDFSKLFFEGEKIENIIKDVKIYEDIEAPIVKEDKLGEIVYSLDGKELGTIDIVASESIAKAKYKDFWNKVVKKFFITSYK